MRMILIGRWTNFFPNRSQRTNEDDMRNMKWIWVLVAATVCGCAEIRKPHQITSDVYAWKNAPAEKTKTGSRRVIVNGAATDFAFMRVVAVTLEKGQSE